MFRDDPAAAVLLVTGFCIVNSTAYDGANTGAKEGEKQGNNKGLNP